MTTATIAADANRMGFARRLRHLGATTVGQSAGLLGKGRNALRSVQFWIGTSNSLLARGLRVMQRGSAAVPKGLWLIDDVLRTSSATFWHKAIRFLGSNVVGRPVRLVASVVDKVGGWINHGEGIGAVGAYDNVASKVSTAASTVAEVHIAQTTRPVVKAAASITGATIAWKFSSVLPIWLRVPVRVVAGFMVATSVMENVAVSVAAGIMTTPAGEKTSVVGMVKSFVATESDLQASVNRTLGMALHNSKANAAAADEIVEQTLATSCSTVWSELTESDPEFVGTRETIEKAVCKDGLEVEVTAPGYSQSAKVGVAHGKAFMVFFGTDGSQVSMPVAMFRIGNKPLPIVVDEAVFKAPAASEATAAADRPTPAVQRPSNGSGKARRS